MTVRCLSHLTAQGMNGWHLTKIHYGIAVCLLTKLFVMTVPLSINLGIQIRGLKREFCVKSISTPKSYANRSGSRSTPICFALKV